MFIGIKDSTAILLLLLVVVLLQIQFSQRTSLIPPDFGSRAPIGYRYPQLGTPGLKSPVCVIVTVDYSGGRRGR